MNLFLPHFELVDIDGLHYIDFLHGFKIGDDLWFVKENGVLNIELYLNYNIYQRWPFENRKWDGANIYSQIKEVIKNHYEI